MKYFISLLLLIINLINYEIHINSFIYLVLHIILFSIILYINKKRNIIFRLIDLLIISWPFSWINIFGKGTNELQLPWFYIFGLLIAIFLLKNHKTGLKIRSINKLTLLTYLFLIIYSIVPLLICKDIKNGLADYIMIMFFVIIMFFAYISDGILDNDDVNDLKKTFVFINLISALGVIFQYVMFHNFGRIFFKLGRSGSYKGYQVSCSLLMEDTSCSTIMMGCGVLFAFMKGKKHKLYYLISMIILIGLALTSRRTSVITLIPFLLVLFIKNSKGMISKVFILFLFPIIILCLLYFLSLSRPVNNVGEYLEDNGRFENYADGINISLNNPIGVGYGDNYLASLMSGKIIPHNTIIRLTDFGGIFLSIPMIIIFADALLQASKKSMKDEFWGLLYVYLASNLIPDILNSRFLLIIVLFVLLYKKEVKKCQNAV